MFQINPSSAATFNNFRSFYYLFVMSSFVVLKWLPKYAFDCFFSMQILKVAMLRWRLLLLVTIIYVISTVVVNAVKCECKMNNDQVRTICIGPSIPPCNCSQSRCEVNTLYRYVSLQQFMCVAFVSVMYLLLAMVTTVGWILMVITVLMRI